MIDKHAAATKLLWVDLEMTGLDSRTDVILEVAAEITDCDFNKIAGFQAAIIQPQAKLDQMNAWCKEQHKKSGLLERLQTEGETEKEVVAKLVDFINSEFKSEPAILAGNSIHNDRQFIKFWWPEVEELLHYRMLDVSSFKILMQSKYDVLYEKKDLHRAFDDVQASISELEYYLNWFAKTPIEQGAQTNKIEIVT
jgi:oligoribonuclease